MKSAIIHDWIINIGGAERVLKEMCDAFPSDLYALFADPSQISLFKNLKLTTSFVSKVPQSLKYYKNFLFLFPFAVEQFDLSNYDLILSSSHCVAKGVLAHQRQLHICYCHTPMRYAWDLYHSYLKELGFFKRQLAGIVLHYLRSWDLNASNRVDLFIANSKYVAKRILKTYKRRAHVIYPPVDVSFFQPMTQKDDFYLTASRLVSYKKVDLIVDAFNLLPGKKLVVIGDGPEFEKIKKRAKSNIEVLGKLSDLELKQYLQRAKAFIFAAEEDFGILPVEAQACSTPVIAFNQGGVLETVLENQTGIFFDKQEVSSLLEAVDRFERIHLSSDLIRKNAERFSLDRFREEYSSFVVEEYEKFKKES